MSEIRIGAYFYPNEPSCLIRTKRANGRKVESEPVSGRLARTLFPGHDQPRSYCLGDINWTDWDDSELSTTIRHVDLANEAQLNFFIVDSYIGMRENNAIQESGGFLSRLSSLPASRLGGLEFGMMCCFRAPRTIMAILPGDLETNRGFDASLETARFISDKSAQQYWEHPNFLKVNGRPYMSFFVPGTGATAEKNDDFKRFFQELKQHSLDQYRIEPYVVAVVSHRSPVADAPVLEKAGVDAVAGYSNLLNFPQVVSVVDHSSLIDSRVSEWETIMRSIKIAVEPTTMIGIDTSPRCQYTDGQGIPFHPTSVEQLKPFIGQYPHSSIVTGSTAETFALMLEKLVNLVKQSSVSKEERIVTINAWNEITEGSCMLPRIRDGVLDSSYIELCRTLLPRISTSNKQHD